MQASELSPILQASIGPVTLISGVGLLLLSMTNRLGRTIDRARSLSEQVEREEGAEAESTRVQLNIIYRRARDLRTAVICGVLSIFAVSLLIMCLFGINALGWQLNYLVIGLFGASLISLSVSLLYFLKDISLELHALKLEIGRQL